MADITIHLDHSPEDDPAFVDLISTIARAVVAESSPEIVTIVQINNWFDHRWLDFSGQMLGAVGVWHRELTLPPFKPSRVKSQTTYRLSNSGDYEQFDAPPLHINQPSSENLSRTLKRATDSGVFIWWTSNTVSNGRGSIMVYAQIDDLSSTWFLGFEKDGDWKIKRKVGIPDALIRKYLG